MNKGKSLDERRSPRVVDDVPENKPVFSLLYTADGRRRTLESILHLNVRVVLCCVVFVDGLRSITYLCRDEHSRYLGDCIA